MRAARRSLGYRDAGVDIDAGDRLVDRIGALVRQTHRPEVLAGVGGFGAAFRAPRGLRDPVFVTSTDGVGTKLRIAFDLGRHNTVGIDLVAMNVNDVLTLGAEPVVFLDYFATGRLDVRRATSVIEGIVEGCRQAGCALVGGETAEMPSFYPAGEYDLAGFVVAAVERRRLIDGKRIRPGHVVVGLGSSGLHSNGYSLVRRVVSSRRMSLLRRVPELGETLGEALLRPTRIYVRPVLKLLRTLRVDGMAHITGGGLPGNLPRVLPRGCRARIERAAWTVPPIFDWLARTGGIEPAEMMRTFNMGLGLVLVVPANVADRVLATFRRSRLPTWIVGEIVRGEPGVDLV